MTEISHITISTQMIKQIPEIDEFKGKWNSGNLTKLDLFYSEGKEEIFLTFDIKVFFSVKYCKIL